MIGTRIWWLKQGALVVTVFGGFLAIAGIYGLFANPGMRAGVVLVLGCLILGGGGLAWRRLERHDTIDKLEEAIYGPEY